MSTLSNSDVRKYGGTNQTKRQLQLRYKVGLVNLLVKAMIDTGIYAAPAPDYLDAVSEAWYTNRGNAHGMTNVILRENL